MQLKRESCLIGGVWRSGGRWLEVDDPATGRVIGRVPDLGAAETTDAIAAASRALPGWSGLTAGERSRILRRFHDLMIARADELAELLTLEQGKPLAEARGEIRYAASFLEWFAEEAKRVYGDVIPAHRHDTRLIVLKQPVGVVAAITPWNFPAAMITRKIAPALAAGCACVVKPAAQTPFTALALAALAEEAGVPAGVLNVVTGSDASAIGHVLTNSPVVRKLSFTGSTPTGTLLYAQSAATMKKLSLELGGNAPFLVFDDADLELAVSAAIASKYRNAGQTCVCANRFYVQAGIHDEFVRQFSTAVAALRVGPGQNPSSTIGPLIDDRAVEKVEAHIADALGKGAHIAAGGSRDPAGPRFFSPTILVGVERGMAVLREETFGPVAPISKFEVESEAIELANDTEFGLAAYIHTRDVGRLWRVAEALEVGMVGANTGLISTEVAPFGGVKMSGLGREGSSYGIEDYLEIKYLCLALPPERKAAA